MCYSFALKKKKKRPQDKVTFLSWYAAAKSLQSCLTLHDPIDGSPPGSPVPGILQARTLEWVAISFSKVWKWKVKVKSLSRVQLLATPWTAAYQAALSMEFSRQKSTGVGCHCLLCIMVYKVSLPFHLHILLSCLTPQTHLCSTTSITHTSQVYHSFIQ